MTLEQAIKCKPHPYTYSCIKPDKIPNRIDVNIEDIEDAVCKIFNVTTELLHEKSRRHECVEGRQVVMYLAYKITKMSNKSIGNYYGGYDHTTVIAARDKVQRIIDTDKEYEEVIQRVLKMLNMKL